jgi:tetratricopeptide (TPR) repeat protein
LILLLRFKNRPLRAGFFLLALLAGLPGSQAQADTYVLPDETDYQTRFEQGVSYMISGNYMSAAFIFEALYADAPTERIKLELARCLYFLGKKARAKQLFEEALETNPPLPVREKIGEFLDDIAISNGKFDYYFGIIRDTNPKAVPSNKTFYLFGIPLTYKPQFDTSPQYGLSYRLIGQKGLDDHNTLIASLSTYGVKFDKSTFDRNAIEAALAYRLNDSPRIQTRFAVEEMTLANERLYDYPSASVSYATDTESRLVWSNEIKSGRLTYPQYAYMNGVLASYTTSVMKNVLPQLNLGVELYIDRDSAAESPYAYRTQQLALLGNYYLTWLQAKAQFRISASKKQFDAADPFFGEIRADQRNMVSLNLSRNDINVVGLVPVLELSYEQTNSNISFYSYKKINANMSFKRAY